MGNKCRNLEQAPQQNNNNQIIFDLNTQHPNQQQNKHQHRNIQMRLNQRQMISDKGSVGKLQQGDRDKGKNTEDLGKDSKDNKQNSNKLSNYTSKIFCCLALWNNTQNPQSTDIKNTNVEPIQFSEVNNNNSILKNQNNKSLEQQNDSKLNKNKKISQILQNKLCFDGCGAQQRQKQRQNQVDCLYQQQLKTTDRFIVNNAEEQENYPSNSDVSPKFKSVKQKLFVSEIEQDNVQQNQSFSNNKANSKNVNQNQYHNNGVKYIIRATNLATVSSYHNSGKIKLSQMSIPFSVIKLSLPRHISDGLNQYYPQFFAKFDSKNSPRASNWRMLQNGTYTNLLQNLHGVFLTKDIFYEGYFVQNAKNKFSPEESGVFINSQYVYKGQFKDGKANGQGKLIQRDRLKNQIYQGIWFQGSIIEGTIKSQQLLYKGQFYNNQPSGKGELKIFNKNVYYKGNFAQGYFEDQDAFYQCKSYFYQGAFKNGKKHGKGALYNKLTKKKLQGKWNSDRINNPFITQVSTI